MREYQKTRVLDETPLTGSGTLTLRLPLDFEAIRYIDFSLVGAIQTTFASGSPAARQYEGALHRLVPTIRVLRESDAFKSVSPHMLRMQQLMATGTEPSRKSTAGASATDNVTADVVSSPAFGTTTQYSSIREACRIFFELPFLKNEWDQRQTWFRTIGLASASIEFQQNAYSILNSDANTAPVTYANSTLKIQTTVTEVVNIRAKGETGVALFKETMKSEVLTAQVSDRRIDVNKGAALAAIHVYCLDGASGSSSTATDKLPSDLLITNMRLWANNDRLLKQTTFRQLQEENRNQFGPRVDISSNRSIQNGYALMNFVDKSMSDLVDTRKGVVDSLDLVIDSASGSVVTYGSGATIFIKIDEVVPLPRSA
jgi:hypothetical protein